MTTECKPKQLELQALGRCGVIGHFDGWWLTSDGGGLLLRELDKRVFGLVIDFGTSQCPKSTRPLTTYCPSRPGHRVRRPTLLSL